MKIEIDYYTDFKDKKHLNKYHEIVKKYKKKIETIIKISLNKENIFEGDFYIGLGIVSKENIKTINKSNRNIDEVTDVLSFPMFDKKEIKSLENIKQQVLLGDIVICLEKVEEQALEYSTGFEREILYMITHGMCHLMGYDHENKQEKVFMRTLEEEILKNIKEVK